MKKCFSFFLSLTATGITAAAQNPPPDDVREMAKKVMMPVVYQVPGMDKVAVKSNFKYTDADDPYLLMDVYMPPGLTKSARCPAVVFVHGGAGEETTPKDWGVFVSWGKLVAASGMAGVTFTHRLTPQKESLVDASTDVTQAISYLRANADSLGINRERIGLVAYSAGGPLLSMAMRDKPGYVRCIVAFYAYMDLQQPGNLFKAHESPDTLRRFSPIEYLAKDPSRIAPIFIARAGRDQVPTMNDSIDRFVREALSRNAALTIANHPEGVHGFDNQTNDDRSREIIRNAIAFMKAHLEVATTE